MKNCSRGLSLFGLLLLAACSDSTNNVKTNLEPSPETSQPADVEVAEASSVESTSPETVALAFVKAMDSEDTEAIKSLMTEKAWDGFSEAEFNAGSQSGEFQVGTAVIDGTDAEVPVQRDGEAGDMHLLMRRTDQDWRVYAIRMEDEGMEMTMDFENLEDMFGEFGEAMIEFAESIEESFESMMMGASEEDLAKEKAVFDALRPLTAEEFDAQWKIDFVARDRTAEDALRELTAGLGLALDTRDVESALAQAVTVGLSGVSRLQAIEEVCSQVNLYPVYPEGGTMMGGLFGDMLEGLVEVLVGADELEKARAEAAEIPANAVAFMEGPRPWPVVFSGPFMFEVDDVIENVPHATGSVSIVVRAFAIEPSAVELTSEGSTLNIEPVSDANGNSLDWGRIGFVLGGNQSSDATYAVTRNISLKNLLRNTTEIPVISGNQQLIYPSKLDELTFDELAEGTTQEMGEFSVELTQLGTSVEFDIRGPEESIENLIVKHSPRDSEGNAMEVTMDMSGSRFDSYRVSLFMAEPPSSVHLKIISVTRVEYPFEIRNIPLEHYSEMPEALEDLAFAGHDAPVTVEFLEIREDPNSPEFMPDKVVVRVTNHSNKDALSVQMQSMYLDGQGTELESFPNTLAGKFNLDHQEPVVEQGTTTEVETTPYFMPDETKTVRIVLQSVGFIDGTTWRSQR